MVENSPVVQALEKLLDLPALEKLFPRKHYKCSVSSGAIPDFRGASIGQVDKKLFMSTGTFSRDAMKEAPRDGVPPIEPVDG